MATFALSILFAVAGFLGLYLVRRLSTQPKQLPLPPGPKPWPVLGNISDLPPKGQPDWKHWINFKHRYGPISSVTALGQTLIILHDKQAASELMEKRAANYSSRPVAVFPNEMCGFGTFLLAQSPGPTLHRYRKLANSQLVPHSALAKFAGLQDVEVRRFLLRLLHDPGASLDGSIRNMTGAILLKMIYGYSIGKHKADPLVEVNDLLVEYFSAASVPGQWLVDMLPILKHVPDWMPGADFKSFARKSQKISLATCEVPFRFTKSRLHGSKEDQDPGPSFVGDLLRAKHDDPDASENAIKWTAASVYGAGIDTTGSSVWNFFLAMSLFPDVQKKAQREIDDVIGPGRLPCFEDRGRLPYINAVVKETQRWLPVVPMGIPHVADEDDVYQGFRIPKGALLLTSTWWFTRDPQVYHDPEAFKPERFLSPVQEPEPASFVFGIGRRICPGRRLADSTIFLTAAKVLAAFDISKARDAEGREIQPTVGVEPGVITKALPFSVRIVPRSDTYVELVKSVEMEHPLEEGDVTYLDQNILNAALHSAHGQ